MEDYVREYLEGFEDKLVQLGVALDEREERVVTAAADETLRFWKVPAILGRRCSRWAAAVMCF